MIYKMFNRKRTEGTQPKATVLRYDKDSGDAPTVVAQGAGHIANKIIELAKANGIPLQENPGLIENLIDMDLGDNVPPQLYAVIAEVLLMIEEMEKRA